MAPGAISRLTLVLGGARSGKSRYAEDLLQRATPPWNYLATAEAGDEEMRQRIADHRARRGERWQTLEVPFDLADAIGGISTGAVLIDCLTLWLSNVLLAQRDINAECDRLIAALELAPGPIVAVSNEVGHGIVPDSPLGRQFRDAQGRLNQRVAAIADHVLLMTAGIPLSLK
jgi:adenosylcobinamide kinase / adenosylcobinamide-phosphate guanylyltransferase